MKIVQVSRKQFDAIWLRLEPSQRVVSDLPTPAIVMLSINTLIVLEAEVKVATAPEDARLDDRSKSLEVMLTCLFAPKFAAA